MVNKVIILGRLGSDPELRQTSGGASVANFSLATTEKWTDKSGEKKSHTEWHRIVVWGKLADVCSTFLRKGKQAYVEGKLQTREWQDKDGQTKYTTEIVASSVQFVGDRNSEKHESGGDEPEPGMFG